MESEAQRAEIADVAAPPGGWPNLSRELVELRFYMERGELDEAFELLTILRDRHPGHPALSEFKRSSEGERPRPDTQVNRVVDSVLAGSQSLNSAMPRRSVPQWKGAKAGARDQRATAGSSTRAHATVPLGSGDGKTKRKTTRKGKSKSKAKAKHPSPVRKRVVEVDDRGQPLPVPRGQGVPLPKTPRATTAKHMGAVPLASAKASDSRPSSNPDAITKPEPIAPRAGSFETPPEEPIRPGLTVAVPTLQAPAPYMDEKAAKNVVRKRSMKSRKRTGRQAQAKTTAGADAPESTPRRRRRGDGFGQHVLGRMGRKKK